MHYEVEKADQFALDILEGKRQETYSRNSMICVLGDDLGEDNPEEVLVTKKNCDLQNKIHS